MQRNTVHISEENMFYIEVIEVLGQYKPVEIGRNYVWVNLKNTGLQY